MGLRGGEVSRPWLRCAVGEMGSASWTGVGCREGGASWASLHSKARAQYELAPSSLHPGDPHGVSKPRQTTSFVQTKRGPGSLSPRLLFPNALLHLEPTPNTLQEPGSTFTPPFSFPILPQPFPRPETPWV